MNDRTGKTLRERIYSFCDAKIVYRTSFQAHDLSIACLEFLDDGVAISSNQHTSWDISLLPLSISWRPKEFSIGKQLFIKYTICAFPLFILFTSGFNLLK